ncbi:hypothetical protein BD311DRAFT_342810 [Dichomitus squalens]|uniref:Uncharacterized protein n=1 Tax=Dichomitus squalens TaxID=114155 RepID=A0A4V2K1T9_9APHY|nr:hypothetical protein BD311DRAFT_342810 [Dichomitus squalens]
MSRHNHEQDDLDSGQLRAPGRPIRVRSEHDHYSRESITFCSVPRADSSLWGAARFASWQRARVATFCQRTVGRMQMSVAVVPSDAEDTASLRHIWKRSFVLTTLGDDPRGDIIGHMNPTPLLRNSNLLLSPALRPDSVGLAFTSRRRRAASV